MGKVQYKILGCLIDMILILNGKETVLCVKNKIIMYIKVVRGSRREGLSFPLILQVVLEIFIFSLQGLTVNPTQVLDSTEGRCDSRGR